ncbi:hypothetical protein NA56DRAFT_699936 [Hyaloscypha hepaticicola]|uniref:Uncharacterized protein n=1 Tax=Hyaloscypha hepaticicola TaxID=2082293 RepID=A0A2J6QFT2_9HELO|nr:hypothetical protein NA56DRAFT_699936 [Hyaloscypha hepaticicola]
MDSESTDATRWGPFARVPERGKPLARVRSPATLRRQRPDKAASCSRASSTQHESITLTSYHTIQEHNTPDHSPIPISTHTQHFSVTILPPAPSATEDWTTTASVLQHLIIAATAIALVDRCSA